MSAKVALAVEQVIKLCEVTPHRPVLIASPDAESAFIKALKERGLTVYAYGESQMESGVVMWHAAMKGDAHESA